jgi:hypothetical protein
MQNYLTHPTSSLSKPDANIVSSSHGSMKIKGRHRRRHLVKERTRSLNFKKKG